MYIFRHFTIAKVVKHNVTRISEESRFYESLSFYRLMLNHYKNMETILIYRDKKSSG